jgi:hypothetical protein
VFAGAREAVGRVVPEAEALVLEVVPKLALLALARLAFGEAMGALRAAPTIRDRPECQCTTHEADDRDDRDIRHVHGALGPAQSRTVGPRRAHSLREDGVTITVAEVEISRIIRLG